MITFSDFSKEDKVSFLVEVLHWYLEKYLSGTTVGLCHAVNVVARRSCCWGGDIQDFMGADIWNPTFAGSQVKNQNAFWWPINDVESRISFITKLIHLYNV